MTLPLLGNASTLTEDIFPFLEGKTVVLRKEIDKGIWRKELYVSQLEIQGTNPAGKGNRSLWKASFKNPAESGVNWGLLQAYAPCTNELQNFFLMLATGQDRIKIISVDVAHDFKTTESSFRVDHSNNGLGFHLDLIPQKASDDSIRIDVKGRLHEDLPFAFLAYLYNHQANLLSSLLSRWQLVYPALPFELALLVKQPESTSAPDWPPWPTIKIDGVPAACISDCFEAFEKAYCTTFTNRSVAANIDWRGYVPNPSLDFMENFHNYVPCRVSPYKVYLMVMGIAEYRHLLDKAKQLKTPLPEPTINIVEGITPLAETPQDTAVEQGKQLINRYLSALTPQKVTEPTTQEIGHFYENYKWAFSQAFSEENSEYYTLDGMKDFITMEIKRLRYYGLDGLITSPPKVEIIWRPPPPPPTPEEIAQREWIRANPPLDDLFTEEEMAALFAEPDYESIKDLHARGMAYDWHLKFTEAEKCFREDGSPMSHFMLGRYYRHDRAGVPANRWKSIGMFNEVARRVTEETKAPTPEELCLAARACLEIASQMTGAELGQSQALRKQAQQLFTDAERRGCRQAALYPLYYECHMEGWGLAAEQRRRLTDLAAMDPDKDLAFMVLAAGQNLCDSAGYDYQPQKIENMAILKRGIQEHLPIAEYFLGVLFKSGCGTGEALKKNPERMKFWLTRAARRGDDRAVREAKARRSPANLNPYFHIPATDEELGFGEEQP